MYTVSNALVPFWRFRIKLSHLLFAVFTFLLRQQRTALFQQWKATTSTCGYAPVITHPSLFPYTVKHLWATVWLSQLLFACTTLLACLYVFLLCGQKTFHPFTSNLHCSIKEASIILLSLVTDSGSLHVQMLENTKSTSRNRLDLIFSSTGFQLIRIKTSTYLQLNFHISCCIDCIEGLSIDLRVHSSFP